MPVLLPFHAMRDTQHPCRIFVPGEEQTPRIDANRLVKDPEAALFIYKQTFRFPGEQQEWMREGVIGLLARTDVFLHEQTFAARVADCRAQLKRTGLEASSLFLWCRDEKQVLAPLLKRDEQPFLEGTDSLGCQHEIWRVRDASAIAQLQSALGGQPIFLADGHHRYSAGWLLATIQIRTPALRTLAAHRLVLEERITLPETKPIGDIQAFWASTPMGYVRFGVVRPGSELLGIELACGPGERNISVLHNLVIRGASARSVRNIPGTLEHGQVAFLVEPISLDELEEDARAGTLLPPKSTDFYPKLAAGLVMHRH